MRDKEQENANESERLDVRGNERETQPETLKRNAGPGGGEGHRASR